MKIKIEKTGRYTQEAVTHYDSGDEYDRKKEVRTLSILRDVAMFLVALVTLFGTVYTIGEGERGVVTRFGEAQYQVDPGLHFKVPLVDGVRKIEIRERKSVEDLAAATKNQLPATTTVSINWTANSDSVMDVYKQYGSLEQFQERILDPKLRQASKAAIAKFNADELIRNRQVATAEILTILVDLMSGYPVLVNSPQIENIVLPNTYMDSVLKKEKAREETATEQYKLEKQKLVSRQKVQTAEAERDALKATADGNAYKTRTEAEADADAIRLRKSAEADGIKEVESALASNPLFVDYTKAKRWNGNLPSTMLGESSNILLSLGAK